MKNKSDTHKPDPSPKKDIKIQGNILDLAKNLTNGDRHADYGPPTEDMERVAILVNTILGTDLEPSDFPIIMICVKLARQAYVHKRDNLIDIAGWIWVKDECHKHEQELKKYMKHFSERLEEAKTQGDESVINTVEDFSPPVKDYSSPFKDFTPTPPPPVVETSQKFRWNVCGDDIEPDAREGALQKGIDEDNWRHLGKSELIQSGDQLKPSSGKVWEPCQNTVGYVVEQFPEHTFRRRKGVPAEYILLQNLDIIWEGDEYWEKSPPFSKRKKAGSWVGQPVGISNFYFRRRATRFTEEDPEYGLPSGCPMPVVDPDPKVEITEPICGVSADFPNGSIILKGEEILQEGDCVRQLGEKTWAVAPAAWHGFPCSNYTNMVFRRPLHVDETKKLYGSVDM